MFEFLDYEILRIIWWILLGVLLIGFAIMDGFDLGVATLLPFVAKSDIERRVLLNSVGPFWDGNQVWLILGAGAIFAACPMIYAVSFSGFYLAMFLALAALILRPVGFDYRSKIPNKTWRSFWDYCLFVSGLVPSLVFGVAIGNVITGIDFTFNDFMAVESKIHFFDLFTPFSLICGIMSVSLLSSHGACFLLIKTEGEIAKRCKKIAQILPWINISLFALGGFSIIFIIDGYQVIKFVSTSADSNPLNKEVIKQTGLWLKSYQNHPWITLAPFIGFAGQIFSCLFVRLNHFGKAFIASAISIFGIISTCGLTIFPFILPSKLNPNYSLTVWDSSSSHKTLAVMLVAVVVLLPVVIAYTSWVYRIMRGKVTNSSIEKSSSFKY
jgi:cytochrome d ubiquinol oxidase subunit II